MLRLPAIVSCASMSLVLALAGCSGANFRMTDQTIPALHGRLMGGQQPISGAVIQLYTVGTSADGSASTPMITKTTVTTGTDGTFNITGDYSCSTSNATDVYITATGGDPTPGAPNVNLTLMAALGQCSTLSSTTNINIDELTSVAAVAALHPYMTSITAIGSSSSDASSLDAAFTVATELVNNATGLSPGSNVPSGHTVPSTLINTLGDVIVPCINSASGTGNTPSSSCATLFSLATPPSGTAPKETVGALLNIENYPTQNATLLWNQVSGTAIQFLPDLSAAPSTWAIGLIPESLSLAAASSTLIAKPDGTPIADALTLTRSSGATGSVTISASGLPTGLTATFIQFGSSSSGSVTFATSSTPAAAGTYTITLSATDGTVTATTTVAVTVPVMLTVTSTIDTASAFSGHLQQFMSTNVLPNPQSDAFFYSYPSTTNIAALNPLHVRIQPNPAVIPWMTNSPTPVSTDWSFANLDITVQPMLTFGDYSPVFQIAEAPPFLNDQYGHFISNATNLALLTTYAQNLVRYYNTSAGFTYAGKTFVSPSGHHITWWEIFNEPNINNVTDAQYVSMYNMLVPAMLAIDPTLKFVAISLSDYSGQPQSYLPGLVLPTASGGLNAQIDAVSTHIYGTCNQAATDASLFSGIGAFVTDINYFHSELAKRSDLANVPVWVNENDVNSQGCYPYTGDLRGTSLFFTAYRPLTFTQFGKASSQAFYQFPFEGNTDYGEVNSSSSHRTLAYWTDYWLERTFPWDGVSTGSTIYVTTTTESTPTVAILAVRNADNSVSMMVTDYAAANVADDNGAGAPRLVYVNLTALGTFSSATEVDLNSGTSPTAGPTNSAITPPSNGTLTLTMSGYGTSMFVLKP
jgi:hypothetical protein